MADDIDAHALNAVLSVAARHANLLQEDAFEELSATVATIVGFERMSILVPEEHLVLRVYAQALLPLETIPFGSRLPADPIAWHALFDLGEPHFVDDMAAGVEVERLASQSGVRSYGAFPIRIEGDAPRTVALLAFTFVGRGAARALPIAVVQAIASAIAPSIERSLMLARERRLAMILDTSGDAMLAWDREGHVTDVNVSASRITGRSRDELIGLPIASLLDPPPIPYGGTAAEGTRLALIARGPGGTRRVPVAASITAVIGDALVAAHALLRDLSQVVRAEREAAERLARIHELEEQHRTLLDNAPLIIFRLDAETGELRYLNRHAERLLGVPTAEALSTPGFLRAAHADPHGVAAFEAAVARAREGALSLPYEAHLARRGGDEITARGTVYPLLAEGGGVTAIEGVLADVSAEHAARTRLVQADRLSTLGNLAAGMAHEINNPAAFILLGLDLLARSLSGAGVRMDPGVAETAAETLRELHASIRRIVDIARDLRVFASPPGPEGGRRAIVDVNRTVEAALSLTRGQILERAQVDRKLGDVPPVLMEDGRLGQVIVNLLVNAVQSIPRSYAADHRIMVETRSDGWMIEIEVTDTGKGIPREHMHRIFQPFFTTKGDVGTGLGLSIGREIIERAGGTITAESPVPGTDPPRGTRFVVSLPVAGNDEPSNPGSSPSPIGSSPPARVLIVEDEVPLARALAEEIGHHHEVVVAGGPDAALARLAEGRFDVVLCDLRMPGMSGDALYAKVRGQDEAQARAFVFMTGVGFGPDVEQLIAESGRPLLEKPFSGETALAEIARVLRKRAHH